MRTYDERQACRTNLERRQKVNLFCVGVSQRLAQNGQYVDTQTH